VHEIAIRTERHTEVVDITARVQEALDGGNGATAALV